MEISFIIPIYNTDLDQLQNCLDSIERQGISSYEVLLINDGSSDKNIDSFCKKIMKKRDYVQYYYQENSGSAVARNTGLLHAKGKYIYFCDADDELVSGFYQNFQMQKDRNFDVMIFDYSFWNQDSERIISLKKSMDLSNEKDLLYANVMFYPEIYQNFMMGSIWSKCFLREFIEKNEIRFVPALRKAQDRMFMLNVYYHAEKIFYEPIYCYKYRSNNTSICHKINFKMIDYYYSLYHEVTQFCQINQIKDENSKFFVYNVVNELLPLTIFHIDYQASYWKKRTQFYEIYNKFQLKQSLKKLKISDFPTKKSKVRFLLYRLHFVYLLYYFIQSKQKKERKYSFK